MNNGAKIEKIIPHCTSKSTNRAKMLPNVMNCSTKCQNCSIKRFVKISKNSIFVQN
ncbi:MAG: DUF116 domain-containing protein [Alistipes sp.]|nr:DUF116 domain-containing protein [Alistipes sp.]